MNGLRLVLTFTLALQLGSNFSAAQVADPFPSDPARDFGWQINDGVLEYIVQISPEKAIFMQQNGEENLSDMPPELVGRIQRVVVRVGTDVLPKTPSKEEIKRTIPPFMSPNDVTASLGAGKFSNLESNSVVNVQGSEMPYPDLPAAPGSRGSAGPSTLPQTTLPRQGTASQPGSGFSPNNRGSLADRFLSDSMSPRAPGSRGPTPSTMPSQTTLPQTSVPGRGPAGNLGALPAGSNKFSNTAPQRSGPLNGRQGGDYSGRGATGNGNWQSPSGNSSNSGRFTGNPNGLTGTLGAGPANNNDVRIYDPPAIGNQAPSLGSDRTFSQQAPSGWGSTPGMSAPAGDRNNSQGSYAGVPADGRYGGQRGGGDAYRPGQTPNSGYGQSGFNTDGPGYSRGGYDSGSNAGSMQPGMSGRGGRSDDSVTRMASNTNPASPAGSVPNMGVQGGNGGNTGMVNGSASGAGNQSQPGSPSDNLASRETNNISAAQRSSDVWLQIFFLVSLIVNFYLGMLIRKLLTRYRSLLSSMRGQAA